jgi:hypothetical protein
MEEQTSSQVSADSGQEQGDRRSSEAAPAGEIAAVKARVVELEESLAMRGEEVDGLEKDKKALEARMEGLGASLAAAVGAYRSLVVSSNPDILPELITGDTVEAVGESLKKARAVVDRIRQDVEAGIAAGRFPAGSPERGAVEPDLSPREKIERGVARTK